MALQRTPYGRTQHGDLVEQLTLSTANGFSVSFITYGATMTALTVHGRDIVLGYRTLSEYMDDTASIGVTVGRYANRIANGTFTLNGILYDVGKNEVARGGHLHGGEIGFQKKIWSVGECTDTAFSLHLHSPHGDMGYPGDLDVTLCVSVAEPHTLALQYTATADRDTVINLTNHAYFNLNGYDGGSVLDTELCINADAILPVDSRLIPTGEVLSVTDTPFDFRTAKPIGQDIHDPHEQIQLCGGYDHNYILNNNSTFDHAVTAYSRHSGITMDCYTDQPGVQLYTGNFLETDVGKGGAMSRQQGFCLETQHYPDSPNHPAFPSTVLHAGATFTSRTEYRFSID